MANVPSSRRFTVTFADANVERGGGTVTFTDTNANCRANANTERNGGTVTFADINTVTFCDISPGGEIGANSGKPGAATFVAERDTHIDGAAKSDTHIHGAAKFDTHVDGAAKSDTYTDGAAKCDNCCEVYFVV